MTNHVHFVAVPQREVSLARAFGEADRPEPEQGTSWEPPKAPAVKNGIVSSEFYRILTRFIRAGRILYDLCWILGSEFYRVLKRFIRALV